MFSVMKIEFVGTIRICGLVTLFALTDTTLITGYLLVVFVCSESGRSDDGSRNTLLPPLLQAATIVWRSHKSGVSQGDALMPSSAVLGMRTAV